MRFRPVGSTVAFLAAAVPVSLVVVQELNGQDVDISGTWIMEIETDADSRTATVTLVQDGASLMGRYSSDAFGEGEVTGTIEGSEFTLSLEAEVQGTALTVTYSGTVERRYPAFAPLREVPLRRLRASVPRGTEPIIYIDGVRLRGATEELTGTVDVGGFTSGTFTARREKP